LGALEAFVLSSPGFEREAVAAQSSEQAPEQCNSNRQHRNPLAVATSANSTALPLSVALKVTVP